MGAVYRATDTSLSRQVAIKVLPDGFAADADRLARFEREAKTLASLNHPHIAAIYAIEKSAGATALVMELVEGDDLAQRIAQGAIPIDEALPIAKQIAEALEAAHEQGIVHRDLKPANVKVRSDGTVKVLDFGLAKALDRASDSGGSGRPGGHDLSASPTLTSPAMTQAGMILGTAAYMAPEQARGKTVDRRADIWAFGAVLYEMLTGTRAFEGEDIADTLGNVMKVEPNWQRLPASVPPRVVQVLRVCLQKNPRQRMGDVQSVRLALEGAFESVAPADAAPPAVAAPRSVAARALPWAVVAVSVVALGVALWAPWRSETPVDRPLVRLDVDLGANVSLPALHPWGSSIVISPDGTRLAYLSGTPPTLFTRRLDQPAATELPGTQGALAPFFSPDGQWVGFLRARTVNKISVDGGAVVPLGPTPVQTPGASWAEDGRILLSDAYAADGGLKWVPDGGGPLTMVAGLVNGELVLALPQILPGGQAVLFTADRGLGADSTTMEVLTLADGRRKIVARGGNSPHYLSTSGRAGHLVYVNKGTLFAVPFDLDRLEPQGTAVPVLDDVAVEAQYGTAHFAVSRTGTLIYRRARVGAAALATVQWVSPSQGAASKQVPLRAAPGAYQQPRLSPDSTRIALVIQDGANQDVWVYDPPRDALTRLTFGGINRYPVWSPDGQYVVFNKAGQGLFQARADGARPPQALVESTNTSAPWSFTPDGRRLAYVDAIFQIWTVPLEDQGGQLKAGTPERFLTSSFRDRSPSFSPDGRWLAYDSNESGPSEVYVRAFPPPASGQGGKWQISNSGGTLPQWSRTRRELVYQSGDQLMTVNYTVNGASFVADKPRAWIAAFGAAVQPTWDLAPDGTRVAAVIPVASTQAPQQEHVIVMLQNFADELRRRVPLGK